MLFLDLYILNQSFIAWKIRESIVSFLILDSFANLINSVRSEMNPKTDISIVNSLVEKVLYFIFKCSLIFVYFSILNYFDFSKLLSWHTVSSKITIFEPSTSAIWTYCRLKDFIDWIVVTRDVSI